MAIIEVSKKVLRRLDELELEYILHPLEGFTYVPSIKLHVAEEINHIGKNWYEAHEALAEKDSRMLTIPEFIKFLNYVKEEKPQLYKKITQARKENPWRLEWLDAYFKKKRDGLYVLTGNQENIEKLEDGLYAIGNNTNAEKLENALMEERIGISFNSWLKKSKQGLPRSDIKEPESDEDNLTYCHPEGGRVAGLEVSPGNILLDCRLKPFKRYTDPVSMVRAAKQLG